MSYNRPYGFLRPEVHPVEWFDKLPPYPPEGYYGMEARQDNVWSSAIFAGSMATALTLVLTVFFV